MDEKLSKRRRIKNEWKLARNKLPWLLLLPAGYGLTRLAAAHPDWTEKIYSQGVFPYISSFFGMISSFVRWVSLAEILLYSGILALLIFLLAKIAALLSGKVSLARFVGFILSVLIAGCVLFNVFYVNWGFNYFRPALSARMGLEVEPRSPRSLRRSA